MSYKEIIDNVSNIEDLDNTTILKVLEKFSKTIKDFAIEQSGLNNLINVEFIPSDNNTTYTGTAVDYLGTLKMTLSDNIIVNKPCNIKFNIKGSNTIVVDVDEFNNSLELNLDNSVVTTLDFAESERQKSKNLLLPFRLGSGSDTETKNGITCTVNSDNSITINGTATARAIFYFNTDSLKNIGAGTYTFGYFSQGVSGLYLQGHDTVGGNYPQLIRDGYTTYTLTFDNAPNFSDVYISVSSGVTLDNVILQPIAVKGTEIGDYQAYNGAIVHEKDISDVEHIETIYDMSSTDSNINWGQTSGITGGVTISDKDFSKYKELEVYVCLNISLVKFTIDLTQSIIGLNTDFDYYYISGAKVSPIDSYYSSMSTICYVNPEKTSFCHHAVGYDDNAATFNERNNNDSYVVYKIKGVY